MGSSMTTSAIRAEAETGSHLFKVFGYSLTKGIGIGQFISSDVFTIGGYSWLIKFYPDGETTEAKDFMSLYLKLDSVAIDVRAKFTCTIVQQNGVHSDISAASNVQTFNNTNRFWGWHKFVERSKLEASECLKNDAFTIKCTITVLKRTLVQRTTQGVPIPPSNLNERLVRLLESEAGADVTFVVKGERFKAHRFMLAAQSAVFNAELFGCMREKWADTITVDDIEPPVFKSMLFFIYSDSLPDLEGKSDDNNGEEQDLRLMAQHLLVAADRYDLERLKLMCEDFLCKNLDVSMVVSTLILAEKHNCNQLKAECLRFLASPEFLEVAASSDGVHQLLKGRSYAQPT
ncbi:BTB/POZ and MATH domain-containing protein 2 [Rhynchospora pubera]|uniref:BTB/POZ and MATH domain-containing protein 2 n=1 Tax=Rhynchospora pubera TaxID=906938 RepID=A0AAV8ES35_9POAL|nr:BTB/POZ and MATH domain-containing protein 2 [Rhynchospora pubera]